MRTIFTYAFLLGTLLSVAQGTETVLDTIAPTTDYQDYSQLQSTDSLLLAIVDAKPFTKEHVEATLIDSLWLKEMYYSKLYDTVQFILKPNEIRVTELRDLPTSLLKERLAHLDSQTPFNVAYNPSLENIIKSYLKRRKSSYSTLLERARYYFPMFEEKLDQYDIPLEMKYLAIVESALRPRAKSHMSATGLWQFMYATGKQFDLQVSSYVDERSDPLKATEAACKYLGSLYRIFGDWDLALAAYNSGPGNVSKAIRRAGGSRNYWNIRHFLPRETAGYVPAFYATLYIMEYADEHGIVAKKDTPVYFEMDTIHVKHQITFEQIYETVGVDIETLQFLNPQYKLDIIPFVKGRNYTLTLPKKAIGKFVSNEAEIYAYVKVEEDKREKPLPKYFEMNSKTRYRVKSGDYLGKIADKFGVSISKIKRWNGMRSNRLKVGQRLTIYPRKLTGSTARKTKKKTTAKRVQKPLPTGPHQVYKVQTGDSLWLIAQKYEGVSTQNIKEWNNIWSVKSLKPGLELKIYSNK
ncbi:MAG: lytic transglycosylase [Flavobacteriaceae bacterium]|nr:MAG: lytic transglycosylase [Flavobacteriaceae bacterium]